MAIAARKYPNLATGGAAARHWLLCGCLAVINCSWGESALQPAPGARTAADTSQQPVTLYLELLVNGVRSSNAVPVRQTGGDLQIRLGDLLAAGIRRDAIECRLLEDWLPLTQCPQVDSSYDTNALLLNLSVPVAWLTPQYISGGVRGRPGSAAGGSGALLSYDVYTSRGSGHSHMTSLWSEQRVFTDHGVLANTGMQRWVSSDDRRLGTLLNQDGYVRYDTRWSHSDETRLLTWTVGDFITGSQGWGTSTRLGGIKLARDFRLRPDLITYPLPQFAGQATIPTTVDLFVNGYRTSSGQIQPGPFTISNIPVVTGAGEATIVTTDALGRQVATTLPFYMSSDLLQKSLMDFSVSAGALRRDYGLASFTYGRPVASAAARYGWQDYLTLEGQLDLAGTASAGTFILSGAGAVFKAGMAGVFNAALSRSDYANVQGWQHTFGYRYTHRAFSFSYQTTRSTDDFRSLNSIDPSYRVSAARRSDVVTASWSSGVLGTLGAGYFRLQGADGARLELLNLSYTRQLRQGVSAYISANRDLDRNENSALLQVVASFGNSGTLTLGAAPGGDPRQYVNYSRNMPSQGGLGWNFGYQRQDDTSQPNGSLAWSNRYNRAEAGVYGLPGQRTQWGSLRGSVAFMDGQVFATRQISDAFVVISTDGVADVPVRYENQLIGVTDSRGYLLVPWVTSHYGAKYTIDPLNLPPELQAAETERHFAVRRNSGAVLRFPVRPVVAATITLLDRAGNAIPVGSSAEETLTDQWTTVGYDGLVYFENLRDHGELAVTLADGSVCHTRFQLPDDSPQMSHVGPITCQ